MINKFSYGVKCLCYMIQHKGAYNLQFFKFTGVQVLFAVVVSFTALDYTIWQKNVLKVMVHCGETYPCVMRNLVLVVWTAEQCGWC